MQSVVQEVVQDVTRAVWRVVVTGAECTGKTTLAQELAEQFAAPLSREFARVYAEQNPRELTAEDVEPIGRGQLAIEQQAVNAAIASGARLAVHDTDLLSTVIYASFYYGACPEWIVDAAAARRPQLYLICSDELSWEADGVRADVGDRAPLQRRFLDAVSASGSSFVVIAGGRAARRQAAISAIDALVR
jgi:NadR type nicotinamide-nucleotide adenylyltransferase